MTHPDYRRKGLYKKLLFGLREDLQREGIYFVYTFPGEILREHKEDPSVHKRFGTMTIFLKLLDSKAILKGKIKNEFLYKILLFLLNPLVHVFFRSKKKRKSKAFEVLEISNFDNRINDFWKEVSEYFTIIVERKREYLNWRYFKRPNLTFKVLLAEKEGRILGYLVYSFAEGKGAIIDFLFYPSRHDVFKRLIYTSVNQLKKQNVNMIQCWLFDNKEYFDKIEKGLRDEGFKTFQKINKYLVDVEIYSPNKISLDLVKNPKKWFLTLGDTDGIFWP
jgi:hypothetical protein